MAMTGNGADVAVDVLPEAVAKAPSGVRVLDEVTGGGLRRGRPTLVAGAAGCGPRREGVEAQAAALWRDFEGEAEAVQQITNDAEAGESGRVTPRAVMGRSAPLGAEHGLRRRRLLPGPIGWGIDGGPR